MFLEGKISFPDDGHGVVSESILRSNGDLPGLRMSNIYSNFKENDMSDILKRAFLTGLGVAALSKDKLEEISKDLTEKGNMTEQEGRKFIEELSGHADRARGELEKQVDAYVEKALKRIDLVRKAELDELRATVEELQTKLSDMQQQLDDDGKGEVKE